MGRILIVLGFWLQPLPHCAHLLLLSSSVHISALCYRRALCLLYTPVPAFLCVHCGWHLYPQHQCAAYFTHIFDWEGVREGGHHNRGTWVVLV